MKKIVLYAQTGIPMELIAFLKDETKKFKVEIAYPVFVNANLSIEKFDDLYTPCEEYTNCNNFEFNDEPVDEDKFIGTIYFSHDFQPPDQNDYNLSLEYSGKLFFDEQKERLLYIGRANDNGQTAYLWKISRY